ncbi:MAG: hypothetical protein U0703_27895 [Anaerolineae bacterium]
MTYTGKRHPKFGYPVCGADTEPNKWGVEYCCTRPMSNGKCRKHGGKTPSGIASPHFKTGMYTRYMPPRLLERYHESLSNPDRLALDDAIAIIDARLVDELLSVDQGGSVNAWEAAGEAYQELKTAMSTVDIPGAQVAMTTLEAIFTRQVADRMAWVAFDNLLEQRRKLVDTDRKRRRDMQQMITIEHDAAGWHTVYIRYAQKGE